MLPVKIFMENPVFPYIIEYAEKYPGPETINLCLLHSNSRSMVSMIINGISEIRKLERTMPLTTLTSYIKQARESSLQSGWTRADSIERPIQSNQFSV